MGDDLGPAREGDDRAAAIAAERVGLGDDAIQSRGDRGAVHLGGTASVVAP